jgi:hypothetical protein
MKQTIQTQLLNLSEEKQKELYELSVAVRTQLAKENKNKKLSLTYMNLKNKRDEFVRMNFPNVYRIDRGVIGTIWATLYNKFY